MRNNIRIIFSFFSFVFLFFISISGFSQVKSLDDFETKKGWSFIQSDAVNLYSSLERGITGNAIRFDYDFTKGTGYGGIQKLFPIDLPDNYEFTFYIKADSPSNNFEIKFIDSTGNNVWWVNNRNYSFPGEWKKIRIKKRHISFAWGPTNDHNLKRIDRIEFTIASFVGGKGTVWIDDLRFEPLPSETTVYPKPHIIANTTAINSTITNISDNKRNTFWVSKKSKKHEILLDLRSKREFGGLDIDWEKGKAAKYFEIYLSDDGLNWDKVYQVENNLDSHSFIYLPEYQANYMKILCLSDRKPAVIAINELKFIEIKNSMTKNDFLIYCAKNSKKGYYPSYFLEQASYWTISGVNNDTKEALLSENGMVELEKALFSVEPMIKIDDSLYNWSNVAITQSMGKSTDPDKYEFIPSVNWNFSDISFKTELASGGEAEKNSQLYIKYSFQNLSSIPKEMEFFMLIRPFQVNPYYQFLNMTGGAGKIFKIEKTDDHQIKVDDKVIFSQIPIDQFGASVGADGNIVKVLENDMSILENSIFDKHGDGNAFVKYKISLNAGETYHFIIKVPYHEGLNSTDPGEFDSEFDKAVNFWYEKVNHIKFKLPESANQIINTIKSNIVYILINRDKAGIQPGSRSYERSWIRDGSLTSSALLKNGIVSEVSDFIEWYASNLYENGKVPCVVDTRGPDPVPENDSHGQLIYLIHEYFNFTKDTAFLKVHNKDVIKVVAYIKSLISERLKDEYLTGSDSLRAFYGLVPESISHEGYSSKPMHSYWDDFFILKGLKDAQEIQIILGEKENFEFVKAIRDQFQTNLYNSLDLAMKYKNIDYIPGCVELGDFDATSTTVLLTPCNEFNNLPKPEIFNTFDKYYKYFSDRRDNRINSINYTPYENRVIGSFIMLNQPDKAHELIDFFLKDQRPQGWYHWAEVVWKDYRHPAYIGDMPHTWCGSDFINAVRSMFVYENELDKSLVIASALYQDWIDSPEGMSVQNMPTYFGEISYSIKKG
ncbi:MAG: discoidin domain-containing protein [Saprospiraceae bacterium]|nr:discoidin domain-containing protein [Saprospiraceae bacterium]